MKTGWSISISLHAAMVILALFLVPYDDNRDRDLRQVAQVSLVSEMPSVSNRESAPKVRDTTDAIAAPEFNPDAGPAPAADSAPEQTAQDAIEDPSSQDSQADLSALTEEMAQPDVSTDVAAPDESQQDTAQLVLPGNEGMDSSTEAPRGPKRPTPLAPREAPRIGSFEAPPPPRPTPPEPEPKPAPAVKEAPSETAAKEPPPEESAPKETTTAPSPDKQSGEETGLALRRSTAPRARPRDFEAQAIERAVAQAAAEAAAAAKEEPKPEEPKPAKPKAEEPKPATPKPAETPAETGGGETAVADNAPKPSAPETVPMGKPLTGGEKDALRLAVQECWNIPAGLENATDLRVVVSAELDPNGKIVGPISLIEPADDSRREIRTAFEAARRALLRCQGDGYDLPREKYQQWRNLEVAFDPKGMLLRW